MKFDSIDMTYHFWLAYGAPVDFGVRKFYVNKNKKCGFVSSCGFVCSKEGPRKFHIRDTFVSTILLLATIVLRLELIAKQGFLLY